MSVFDPKLDPLLSSPLRKARQFFSHTNAVSRPKINKGDLKALLQGFDSLIYQLLTFEQMVDLDQFLDRFPIGRRRESSLEKMGMTHLKMALSPRK